MKYYPNKVRTEARAPTKKYYNKAELASGAYDLRLIPPTDEFDPTTYFWSLCDENSLERKIK